MVDGDTCGDSCGWLAAFLAALSYGSYGVPIKAAMDLEVHPLVFQSYKTVVLFFMSCLVLLLGEEPKWTSYGILSGFLWVLGGSFGIVGIRQAGMATAVGTWASVMVLVNFIWGILVFREPVHSFFRASLAFFFLGLALVGMSRYTSLESKQGSNDKLVELVEDSSIHNDHGLTSRRRNEEESTPMLEDAKQDLVVEKGAQDETRAISFVVGGVPLTQREFGILCAALNGVLAGSSLVPLHYAKAQGFGGRSYILSFGSGSLTANCIVWVAYFLYLHFTREVPGNTWRETLDSMPSLYLKEMWFRGLMAGVLLAIGMFGSIYAVTYLGQGVGNSLVQSKIIISGLWGICWFKEIKDPNAITKWFASASVGVLSILWLSYERNSASPKP